MCREAGVSICCQPNATIEERVIEPVNGGVNVTYMSDNIRDTWQPYGNADMLQLALFVARLGSWRTKEELDHLLEMGSMGAARAIGLAEDHGVAVGKRTDMVVFEAKSGHGGDYHLSTEAVGDQEWQRCGQRRGVTGEDN